MTGLDESRMSQKTGSGRRDDALELVPDLSRNGAVDRRMGPSGSLSTTGYRHPSWRESPCAVDFARNGTPSFSASWRAPPWPKMSDLRAGMRH